MSDNELQSVVEKSVGIEDLTMAKYSAMVIEGRCSHLTGGDGREGIRKGRRTFWRYNSLNCGMAWTLKEKRLFK